MQRSDVGKRQPRSLRANVVRTIGRSRGQIDSRTLRLAWHDHQTRKIGNRQLENFGQAHRFT